MEALRAAGLQDQVTFAAYNVFGRTLKKNGVAGRDHWGSHHATVMIGKRAAGRRGRRARAQGERLLRHRHRLDHRPGKPGGGDIPFAETLAAMGKTLGAAVGVPAATCSTAHILGGKVVPAALI